MKDFKDLNEEEIIEEGLRAIPDYLEGIRGTGNFRLEACVAAEVERLKGLYMKANGFRLFAPLTASEIQELDTFTAHFIPILTERTIPVQQKYMQRQRLSQINATTARALIQAAFKEKGLEAEITGQIYRAKVVVSLSKMKVRLYVPYKEMTRDGFINGIVNAVLDLKDATSRLGHGVRITNR